MVGFVLAHWYNHLSEFGRCTTDDDLGSGKHPDNGQRKEG